MRGVFVFWFLLATCVPAAPALANEAESSPITIGRQKAMQLLDVSSPLQDMKNQFVSNFISSFNKSIDTDARFAPLEARKPGLRKALKAAVAAETERQATPELSLVRRHLADLFEQVLTIQDMDTAIAFFSSPAGTRIKQRMMAGSQAQIDQMRETGELRRDLNAGLEKVVNSAAASGLENMSAEDSLAVVKFGQTPASRKMEAIRPQFMSMMSNEMQVMAGRVVKKISPVVGKAIADHMSKK
ncbi:MAG: DUF2059 domain-containing protein [Pseudomonadota bacterium]|mgnify:CR=1 FL=1|uniref:DUF2059 domain-containing protein n=1 Tax=Sphingobium sp. TaxID=1912891 RepID=UPI002E22C2DA